MKQHLDTILRFITMAAIVWVAVQVTRGNRSIPDSTSKNAIYDSVVSMVKKDMQSHLDNQDRKIEALLRNDSIIASKIPAINERINKIPVRINNLSDDDLWREISRAYPPK